MLITTLAKKIFGRKQVAAKPAVVPSKRNVQAATPAAKVTATARAPWPAGATIAIHPLVTEKSVKMQGATNTVAFRADRNASKGQLFAAVQSQYNVTPLKVRVVAKRPKVRRRGQTTGHTAAWKKAYVTLPEGKHIEG